MEPPLVLGKEAMLLSMKVSRLSVDRKALIFLQVLRSREGGMVLAVAALHFGREGLSSIVLTTSHYSTYNISLYHIAT